jgi:hypothetical protein
VRKFYGVTSWIILVVGLCAMALMIARPFQYAGSDHLVDNLVATLPGALMVGLLAAAAAGALRLLVSIDERLEAIQSKKA